MLFRSPASAPANAPASTPASAPADASASASADVETESTAASDVESTAASDAESTAASDTESTAASDAESAAASDAESDDTEPYVDVLEVGSETDPDKSGVDSSALDQLMGELSKGQTAKWKSTEEIVVEGGLDWLLSADVEVATIRSEERRVGKEC